MPDLRKTLPPAELDLARGALAELGDSGDVGELLEVRDEGDGVVTVFFECNRRSYRGWRWAVSIAHVEGEASVLEAELVPGEDALVAPDWVPWADRLAEYRAAQAEAKTASEGEQDQDDADSEGDLDDLDLDDLDDDDDDDDDLDDDDDDEFLPEDRLDSDDIDGVDIDSLDE